MEEAIHFTTEEVEFASGWHGGQNSMLYAIASTGKLSVGSESFRRGRPDTVWLCDLVLALIDELLDVNVHFYGDDVKVARSISAKLDIFIKKNQPAYEKWYEENED